jgi:hypothetical protein
LKLTDTAIRNARPGDRPRKLFDGDGLYLFISTTGHKAWRFKYYFDSKEKAPAVRPLSRDHTQGRPRPPP